MEQKELKYFADPQSSGLNGDDADFVLPTNQVVNGENVRWGSTDKGATGWVESVASNLLLSEVQPSVTFITIGSVTDTAKNRIYYFLYNQYTPDHKIMCWDDNLNRFYTVLLSTQVTGGLDFDKNYPIQAWVVEDLLYWTDGNVSQKKINVESAIALNQPGYSGGAVAYTTPIAQSTITLIKRPPLIALTATLGTEGTLPNLLAEFAGQFAWRYVYRDGEVSVFSPPTEMIPFRYFFNGNVDTRNKITLSVNLPATNGETIEQDVLVVELAVRYNNDPAYFIIKSWNKNIATEESEIAAYNAGSSALSFDFYNSAKGDAVSVAESIKLADAVPITSKSGTVAGRRNFLANNVVGYDTPTFCTLEVEPSAVTPAVGTATPIHKTSSSRQVGIRFRDEAKRQSAVFTNDNLIYTIPQRGDYNSNSFALSVNWNVTNVNADLQIPDWATHYDILATKNLTYDFYIQWITTLLKYAVKNSDGTYTYQDTYTGFVYGLAITTGTLGLAGKGVIYTSGDMVGIRLDGSSTIIRLSVIGQDGDYVIVKAYDLGNLSTITAPVLIEYYTPHQTQETEFFYTTGNSYKINSPGTDSRQFSTTSGTIPGDSFFMTRTAGAPFSVTYYTEDMSPNDNVWDKWYTMYGERNIQSLLGQKEKVTSVVWSNTFIPGTLSNGLSTFEPLNEKILPEEMGALRRLILTSKIEAQGGVMLAIGEDETASLYLGEVQTYGSDQRAGQVFTVDNVIGTVNVLRGNFGTVNPESVTEYRGMVFWYDATNGRVIQYSQNGLYPISNYKMTRFWKLFSDQYNSMTAAQIEALGDRPFVFMSVDPYHDELLISIPKLLNTPPKGYLPDYPSTIFPFDVWDGQGKTMVFDLKSEPNRWMPTQSFVTENFITLQNKLFSFKSGQLYIHNQTTSYNQFYGVQNKSKLMFVCNQEPNGLKVYNNISIQNNSGSLLPSLAYFYVDNPYQQATDLVDFDWNNLEGILYATLYRNKLVPTATGYDTNGLLTAEKIRTNALKVMLQYDVINTPLQLRFVTVGYINSIGHNQVKI
jgi:hypothetical protein